MVIIPQLCVSTASSSSPPPIIINENEPGTLLQQYLKPQRAPSGGSSSSTTITRELQKQQDTVTSSRDSHSTDTSYGSQLADLMPVKVRGGAVRRPAGYQVSIDLLESYL